MKKATVTGKKGFIALTLFSLTLFFLPESNAQFANGADISWLSQMEAAGYVFYNSNGIREDCMQILKEKGINSLRFRVWVNPSGGWCGKKDVATMALRAQNMGFRIMIDFHYSDSWADPGKQNKPAAWLNDSINQLYTDIYNHTYSVLDTLKSLGITPEWVQVGNEVDNGMLWPDGMASTNMKNFAAMITSGYNAVKAVDSTTKVIVHLSGGFNNELYRWLFDGLVNNGAKWDVIGMSLYPAYYTSANWHAMDSLCLSNMADMQSRYGKEVMICESGMDYATPYDCNAFLLDIIDKVKQVSGLGVFYWEPECYNWQGYTLGAWDPVTMEPTIALDAFNGISYTSPTFTNVLTENNDIQIFPNPVVDKLNVRYHLDNAETVELSLTDITGKPIMALLPSTLQSPGTYTFTFSLGNNIPGGLYILKIKYNGVEPYFEKIIKIQ